MASPGAAMVPRAGPLLVALLLALLPSPTTALLPPLPDDVTLDENNLPEGAPVPLSFPEATRLLRHLQQQQDQDHQADPRLIAVTDGGLYRGGESCCCWYTVLGSDGGSDSGDQPNIILDGGSHISVGAGVWCCCDMSLVCGSCVSGGDSSDVYISSIDLCASVWCYCDLHVYVVMVVAEVM